MPRVLLTIADVGVAIDLQERLERAGHTVEWDASQTAQSAAATDLVVTAPGADDANLAETIGGWRSRPDVPAVVILGTEEHQIAVGHTDAILVTSTADHGGIENVVTAALGRRFVGPLTPTLACAALGLGAVAEAELGAAIIAAGRAVDPAIVRPTLERRVDHYVWSTDAVAELRERRALEHPELELLRLADGSTTLKTVVKTSGQPPMEAGKRLWALACARALDVGPEPPDLETAERRRVAESRRHLRARAAATMPTAYDVLAVTRDLYVDDLDAAVSALGFRHSPDALADVDLGDAAPLAEAQWKQIVEARSALYYELGQKQLNAFIDAQPARFEASWGRADLDARAVAASFVRGQKALSGGEVFQAISDIAAAARGQEGHPVYESYVAWARYRVEVARGGDRSVAASRERKHAEDHIYGRRPFAQALVALGLLCVADGDPASARWHLRDSLTLDPDLPAAKIILRRLS